MLAGQSGWYDHVQWHVLDLQFRPQWEYSVELTSSILALNKQSLLAVAAWKMAMWMTERPFWGKVLYGDKDTIRLSLLLFGACVTFPPLSPLSLIASRSPLPTPPLLVRSCLVFKSSHLNFFLLACFPLAIDCTHIVV
jgi:hypothetical protein